MRKFKYYLKRYPEQMILILFNTGVFAWLKTTSSQILSHFNIDLGNQIPTFLRILIGDNVTSLQNIISQSPFIWLIISMVLMGILRFVGGLVKFLIFAAVIGLGVYLVMKNQEMLQSLQLF